MAMFKATMWLPEDLWQRVRREAFDRGIPAQKLVEKALRVELGAKKAEVKA